MVRDILIPSKIGNSYLFSKRFLSFEITQISVNAILVLCKGDNVVIQNKISIILKDFSTTAVVGAIKKIVSTIGKYDEIVTSLSGSSVVFKELKLPFIGYEKLEMVINYEIEPLLPFALDQAVIDFIVIDENIDNHISTILVAAALKHDVDTQLNLFEKAGVSLNLIIVDMFALYTFYKKALYPELNLPVSVKKNKYFDFFKKLNTKLITQDKSGKVDNKLAEMFVDIDFEDMKIFYFVSGILKSVRAVPYGVSDIANSISKKLEISYYDVMQHLIYKENHSQYEQVVKVELDLLFGQITRTISFFENQVKDDYRRPNKIIFSGAGCSIFNFIETAQNFFDMPVAIVDIENIFKSLHITTLDKKYFSIDLFSNLSTAIFVKYNDNCNLLKTFANKNDNTLLYKQFAMVLFLTIGCIGGVLWHSISDLQRWDRAYISSNKELTTSLQTTMGIDVKSERNLKDIVNKAEETLKNERKLWFSFSKQTEQSYLQYLQDLSVHIDRQSIGLDLKSLRMRPDLITMRGALSGNKASDLEDGFAALPVFKEELSELQYLQLVDEARTPEFFEIQLKIKDKGPHDIN